MMGMMGTIFDIQMAHVGFLITDSYYLWNKFNSRFYFEWLQVTCKLHAE